jgi:hypothetical protein
LTHQDGGDRRRLLCSNFTTHDQPTFNNMWIGVVFWGGGACSQRPLAHLHAICNSSALAFRSNASCTSRMQLSVAICARETLRLNASHRFVIAEDRDKHTCIALRLGLALALAMAVPWLCFCPKNLVTRGAFGDVCILYVYVWWVCGASVDLARSG